MQLTEPCNHLCEYCIFFKTEGKTYDLLTDIFLKQHFWIGKGSRKIRELFSNICELISADTLPAARQAVCYLQILILELSALYQPSVTQMKPDTVCSFSDNALAVDWFFLDCKKNLRIEQLADSLGLSIRQTQRFLKEKYGMTFCEKKAEMQLEHAKILLINENRSLSTIAEECGFCSAAAFSAFFKKQTGMTPIQYRNRKQLSSD